jgi:hypothetical protein
MRTNIKEIEAPNFPIIIEGDKAETWRTKDLASLGFCLGHLLLPSLRAKGYVGECEGEHDCGGSADYPALLGGCEGVGFSKYWGSGRGVSGEVF